MPIVLEQIVVTHFGISDQFSYPVQEFMLKNDTLKNGTSRIGLYGSAPPRTLFVRGEPGKPALANVKNTEGHSHELLFMSQYQLSGRCLFFLGCLCH